MIKLMYVLKSWICIMQVPYFAHISWIISVMIYGGTFMIIILQICNQIVSDLENWRFSNKNIILKYRFIYFGKLIVLRWSECKSKYFLWKGPVFYMYYEWSVYDLSDLYYNRKWVLISNGRRTYVFLNHTIGAIDYLNLYWILTYPGTFLKE